MKGGKISVVTKMALRFKIGQWRLYDVVFMTKRAKLITDHAIKQQYKNLYRVTDNLFIGLAKKEK